MRLAVEVDPGMTPDGGDSGPTSPPDEVCAFIASAHELSDPITDLQRLTTMFARMWDLCVFLVSYFPAPAHGQLRWALSSRTSFVSVSMMTMMMMTMTMMMVMTMMDVSTRTRGWTKRGVFRFGDVD